MAKGEKKQVMKVPDDRERAIEMTLATVEKHFGKGAIMRLGDKSINPAAMDVISTGSLGLDIALGVGGIPRGRVVEIYGPESSGKTTLTLHAVAEAQKAGGVCAFIDGGDRNLKAPCASTAASVGAPRSARGLS